MIDIDGPKAEQTKRPSVNITAQLGALDAVLQRPPPSRLNGGRGSVLSINPPIDTHAKEASPKTTKHSKAPPSLKGTDLQQSSVKKVPSTGKAPEVPPQVLHSSKAAIKKVAPVQTLARDTS